jgi:hypothetical protein
MPKKNSTVANVRNNTGVDIMPTWTKINTKQIIRWGIAIFLGSLIAICVGAALTFYRPVHWIHPLFFIRIISVALGSFFSGVISRKYAWLTGVIIAAIHFVFIVFMFFPIPPLIVNNNIVIPGQHWTSILPTGMFMIITGLIFGYLGGKLRKEGD